MANTVTPQRFKLAENCFQQYPIPGTTINQILTCANTTLGRQLMYAASQVTAALDPPLQHSPWILVNGQFTRVDTYAVVHDYFHWVCAKLAENVRKENTLFFFELTLKSFQFFLLSKPNNYVPSICINGTGWAIVKPLPNGPTVI